MRTLPNSNGTFSTIPFNLPSPPFASFIDIEAVQSIGLLIFDLQIFSLTILSWDPVSIIASIGFPSHSKVILIKRPRIFVLNEFPNVVSPTVSACFPGLNLITLASCPDNSLETPIISPTASSTLAFSTWSRTPIMFTCSETADFLGKRFSIAFPSSGNSFSGRLWESFFLLRGSSIICASLLASYLVLWISMGTGSGAFFCFWAGSFGVLALGACPLPGLIGRPVSASTGRFSLPLIRSFNLGG